MTITTINPATGEELETYTEDSPARVREALARAWTTFERWRHEPLDIRLDVLRGAAEQLEKRGDELSGLITAEMGKPISDSRAELEKCAWLCRHYVEHAAGYLAREEIPTEADTSYVRHDPLGPVLAIMPWNFPFWQAFRFAVPNLALGNVGLLKHASNTTGCGLAIAEVFAEGGAPEGAFTTLLIGHSEVEGVIADPRVRGVTLTGSDRAGRSVGEAAGRHLKKSVLELGGSDAVIVLDDADLDLAAEVGAASRLVNSGQSCIAAKRFIVHEDVCEAYVDKLAAAMQAPKIGDPTDPDTKIGPLARDDLKETLHDQVERTLQQGARLVCGGEPLGGEGSYYPPTVLADVGAEMPAAVEETFGPVAAVLPADDSETAIALANATRYGLGAAIFSRDLDRAERLAARVEAGMVFINELVKSDPRLPFGGVKDSGYGRELARPGILEFANVRTVWAVR